LVLGLFKEALYTSLIALTPAALISLVPIPAKFPL
jgi:hypothetical protein